MPKVLVFFNGSDTHWVRAAAASDGPPLIQKALLDLQAAVPELDLCWLEAPHTHPTADVTQETERAINGSDMAVLLLSEEFFASDTVRYALPLIENRVVRGTMQVFCFALENSQLSDTPEFAWLASQPVYPWAGNLENKIGDSPERWHRECATITEKLRFQIVTFVPTDEGDGVLADERDWSDDMEDLDAEPTVMRRQMSSAAKTAVSVAVAGMILCAVVVTYIRYETDLNVKAVADRMTFVYGQGEANAPVEPLHEHYDRFQYGNNKKIDGKRELLGKLSTPANITTTATITLAAFLSTMESQSKLAIRHGATIDDPCKECVAPIAVSKVPVYNILDKVLPPMGLTWNIDETNQLINVERATTETRYVDLPPLQQRKDQKSAKQIQAELAAAIKTYMSLSPGTTNSLEIRVFEGNNTVAISGYPHQIEIAREYVSNLRAQRTVTAATPTR